MDTTWKKIPDNDFNHDAATMYVTDGYKIWKGRTFYYGMMFPSKWHLERVSDGKLIWDDRTAKAVMENFEYAVMQHKKWEEG